MIGNKPILVLTTLLFPIPKKKVIATLFGETIKSGILS